MTPEQEKQKQERKEKIFNSRCQELAPFAHFEIVKNLTIDTTDDEHRVILSEARAKAREAEQNAATAQINKSENKRIPQTETVESLRARKDELTAKLASNKASSPAEKATLVIEKAQINAKLQMMRSDGTYKPPAPEPKEPGKVTVEQLAAKMLVLVDRINALENRAGIATK